VTAGVPSALPPWRRALAEAITDPAELLAALGLGVELLGEEARLGEAVAELPLLVPRGFVARMRPGDPADPLLLQVLPLAREVDAAPGFVADPLGELGAGAGSGLLRKYRGRALLLLSGACAVHCRYCFRRHLRRTARSLADQGVTAALAAIAADPTLEEVILSGGDPLTADDQTLGELARALAAIPHLRRLRVHTRAAVVVPERVDDALLEWLTGTRLRPVVVVHANRAAEIDGAVAGSLARLRASGVTLLNQSVLLAGVNDSVEALLALSRRLADVGVLPYYLHLLDRVRGAAHFEVGEELACRLVRRLAAELPGYLVPRLVRERPGAPGKVLIGPT
jgi:EF-P beta-lysylation protein EpmB